MAPGQIQWTQLIAGLPSVAEGFRSSTAGSILGEARLQPHSRGIGVSRVLRQDYEQASEFVKDVYRVSDAVSALAVDVILQRAATSCPGTALTGGLSRNATEQHSAVTELAAALDQFGNATKRGIDAIQRIDDGSAHTPARMPDSYVFSTSRDNM